MRKSLTLLGWVANWRPIEIFLYDWWPIARRRDLYRRLAAAGKPKVVVTTAIAREMVGFIWAIAGIAQPNLG